MLINFLYILLVLALLAFFFATTAYTFSLLYSSLMGSPYVPTTQKELEFILKEANIKKGKLFLEVGCGDGRVVRTAVKTYQVKGIGIDINPLILKYAQFISHMQKVPCTFSVQNLFDANYRNADYVYLFLMPNLIKKLSPMLENQLKKGALVISHGFQFHDWKRYLLKTILHTPYPTYFYRMKV